MGTIDPAPVAVLIAQRVELGWPRSRSTVLPGHLDDRELRDDEIDDFQAGKRQRAALENLVSAVARRVLHGDHHPARARDEVHRAAHPLHHLAGDHPVGEVAFFVDLQRPKDGQVDVTAANHGKRIGAAEIAASGRFGDGLLTGVDQIGIDFTLARIRTDAQHPVLRVQRDVDTHRHIVGRQRRHPDAEVDHRAIL